MSDDRDEEETKQVKAEIPARTKRLAKEKLDHGGISRVIREALAREVHGERTTERARVKDNLDELRDERRHVMSERDRLNDELQQLDVKIERAERRLDELDDLEGEYEGVLKGCEELLADGHHVFLDHGMVERAAEVGNCSPEDVIEDLKERNPDYPDDRFQPKIS